MFTLPFREIKSPDNEKCAVMRNVNVNYIFGPTGTGKTQSIYEKHPAAEIFRIATYKTTGVNFVGYTGERILVFENFSSVPPIELMIHYMDQFNLLLPADRHVVPARYTKVYILSHLPLERQYPDIQRDKPHLWAAFLRRIHRVEERLTDGSVIVHKEMRHDLK